MISVGRNQNQIFGKIDGVKFPNLPLDSELFKKLQDAAKNANAQEVDKTLYKAAVKEFKALLISQEVVAKVEQVKEEKKQVKVGSGNLKIVLDTDGRFGEKDKPYLVNQAGSWSKFYIPDNLYQRILDGESKGLDVTPNYKFFIRVLKNPVMTQQKLNNLDKYISKSWLDKDLYQQLLDKGYTDSKAKEEATFPQVPITKEGLLHTYKVSSIIRENNELPDFSEEIHKNVESVDEEVEDQDKVEEKPDFEEFRFIPVRNKKGHFYARGSQEYMDEYNKQLRAYNDKHQVIATKTLTSTDKEGVQTKKVVKLVEKYAENYVFQPAYQGTSGDAFYCGDKLGHEIRVGFVHKLPRWDQVNTSDSYSAQPGLHVGGIEYIQGYTNINSPVHNIFVDPQYIGAVVAVENGDGAMRVKEYYVHSVFLAPNKGIYNSNAYAAQTDEEWDKQIKEALELIEKAKEAQKLVDSSFIL